MVFVAVGALAGAVLASRRYRAFLLVPVAASMAAVAFLVGIVHGSHPGAIALEVLGSIVAPQFAYVALSLTAHLTRLAKLVPQVQAAIGQQLRAQLEVPRRLSPELADRVTQLQATR
jgi:hypothetical protein